MVMDIKPFQGFASKAFELFGNLGQQKITNKLELKPLLEYLICYATV